MIDSPTSPRNHQGFRTKHHPPACFCHAAQIECVMWFERWAYEGRPRCLPDASPCVQLHGHSVTHFTALCSHATVYATVSIHAASLAWPAQLWSSQLKERMDNERAVIMGSMHAVHGPLAKLCKLCACFIGLRVPNVHAVRICMCTYAPCEFPTCRRHRHSQGCGSTEVGSRPGTQQTSLQALVSLLRTGGGQSSWTRLKAAAGRRPSSSQTRVAPAAAD
jgi:hypothetical protein